MAIFCFTDIEGSTEKWEKHRAVMGQVIAMHNKILETEVARFGGDGGCGRWCEGNVP